MKEVPCQNLQKCQQVYQGLPKELYEKGKVCTFFEKRIKIGEKEKGECTLHTVVWGKMRRKSVKVYKGIAAANLFYLWVM